MQPLAKICRDTGSETVLQFLDEVIIIYGVSNTIESAALSYQKITLITANQIKIRHEHRTANLNTGTKLAERTMQLLKNLITANLEQITGLRECQSKALYVLTFTPHAELKTTPFEAHGRKSNARLTNLINSNFAGSKELFI